MNRRLFTIGSFGLIAGTLGFAGNAHAWLGGFEGTDGYQPFLNRVQEYNAGHYGPNSGYGGAYSLITPNTDFWKAVTEGVGGSYTTGHQNFDRAWVNNGIGSPNNLGLQFTTGASGFGGNPVRITYDLDAPDFGGVAPSSTGNATVNFSFWWRGQLNGTDSLGLIPDGYLGNAVQFKDSSGNVGFELGMTQRVSGDKVTYWNGATMFESTILASGHFFDRWDVKLDMVTDTVSVDFFDFSTSTLIPVVVNQPMMNAMNNFTRLDFRTSPGTFNDKFNGMVIDDTHASVVPEPTTVAALGLVAAALMMRRPRRA